MFDKASCKLSAEKIGKHIKQGVSRGAFFLRLHSRTIATAILIFSLGIILGIISAQVTGGSKPQTPSAPQQAVAPAPSTSQGSSLSSAPSVNPPLKTEETNKITTPEPAKLVWPVSGNVIQGPRWFFSNEMKEWRFMPGTTINCEEHSKVKAAFAGEVISVGPDPILGPAISIKHADGYETRYGPVQASIEIGQTVMAGQAIGNTLSDKLYFVLLKNGEVLDPSQLPVTN